VDGYTFNRLSSDVNGVAVLAFKKNAAGEFVETRFGSVIGELEFSISPFEPDVAMSAAHVPSFFDFVFWLGFTTDRTMNGWLAEDDISNRGDSFGDAFAPNAPRPPRAWGGYMDLGSVQGRINAIRNGQIPVGEIFRLPTIKPNGGGGTDAAKGEGTASGGSIGQQPMRLAGGSTAGMPRQPNDVKDPTETPAPLVQPEYIVSSGQQETTVRDIPLINQDFTLLAREIGRSVLTNDAVVTLRLLPGIYFNVNVDVTGYTPLYDPEIAGLLRLLPGPDDYIEVTFSEVLGLEPTVSDANTFSLRPVENSPTAPQVRPLYRTQKIRALDLAANGTGGYERLLKLASPFTEADFSEIKGPIALSVQNYQKMPDGTYVKKVFPALGELVVGSINPRSNDNQPTAGFAFARVPTETGPNNPGEGGGNPSSPNPVTVLIPTNGQTPTTSKSNPARVTDLPDLLRTGRISASLFSVLTGGRFGSGVGAARRDTQGSSVGNGVMLREPKAPEPEDVEMYSSDYDSRYDALERMLVKHGAPAEQFKDGDEFVHMPLSAIVGEGNALSLNFKNVSAEGLLVRVVFVDGKRMRAEAPIMHAPGSPAAVVEIPAGYENGEIWLQVHDAGEKEGHTVVTPEKVSTEDQGESSETQVTPQSATLLLPALAVSDSVQGFFKTIWSFIKNIFCI
jgi:hypothetical protein